MSDPRSILLHIDDSKHIGPPLQIARGLAETFGAQVTAQYAVMPYLLRYPFVMSGTAATLALMQQEEEQARRVARSLFDAGRAGDPRLSWSEQRCDARGFTAHALYSDLVIVAQRDPGDAAIEAMPADFVSRLIVDSGKPVLVVPQAGAPAASRADTVMVAWKETREAARAVSAALPWLQRAKRVHVSCFGKAGAAAIDRLAGWLAGHGVADVVRDAGPDTAALAGELLLSRAADVGADLLVMGCYGHSRSREWVLGGASRTVLGAMTVPTLLAH